MPKDKTEEFFDYMPGGQTTKERLLEACKSTADNDASPLISFIDSQMIEGNVISADLGNDLSHFSEPDQLRSALGLCYEPEYAVAAARIRARLEVVIGRLSLIAQQAEDGHSLEEYSDSDELHRVLKTFEAAMTTTGAVGIEKRITVLEQQEEAELQPIIDHINSGKSLEEYKDLDQLEAARARTRKQSQNRDFFDRLNERTFTLTREHVARKLEQGESLSQAQLFTCGHSNGLEKILEFCKKEGLVNGQKRIQEYINEIEAIINAAKTGTSIESYVDSDILIMAACKLGGDKRECIDTYRHRLLSIIPRANRSESLIGFAREMLESALTKCGDEPQLSETKQRIQAQIDLQTH